MTLKCTDIEHTYFGCPQDLFGVSLSVEKGEFVVILGKRSAGKTPLLKALAGFEKPNKGTVTLDDNDIFKIKGKNRNIVLTLERDGFFKYRSVAKNLEYPLKLRKVKKKERIKIVDDIIEKTHLEGAYYKPAMMLEEPDYSKASVARALVRQADYYLLDNPFRYVTVSERREVFLMLKPLIESLSGGVIYATDSIDEAIYFNKRTIILDHGKIVFDGDLSQAIHDKVIDWICDDITRKTLEFYKKL